MKINITFRILIVVSLFCQATFAQTTAPIKPTTSNGEAESAEAQRRNFAVSLITSLADDAKTFSDEALRALVLARSADAIWDADIDAARLLFRRAWDAAEKKDNEKPDPKAKNTPPAMVLAIMKVSGRDLRAEVLALAAKRDRALGEEFLEKLTTQSKRDADDAKSKTPDVKDGWTSDEASIKRLVLARRLLDQNEVERALEIAIPALNVVTANSIGFLSALRLKRSEMADQRFSRLLSLAERDPQADANTVSGLSSYLFSPAVYVTFSAEGGVRWTQQEEGDPLQAPPVMSAALISRFFQTASSILLRPLPPPQQDTSSSGRVGKSMVLKRLLPLFEQYAPDTAVALRAQLTALSADPTQRGIFGDDHRLLTEGLQTKPSADSQLQKIQDRLDRAKTVKERDAIHLDAAVLLAMAGDSRAIEMADKIDDVVRKGQARKYVQLEAVRIAIAKKRGAEVAKLAKGDALSNTERAWAFAQAARLLLESDRQTALELLEEAANEARRIEASNQDRARSLVAVATQFAFADRVRAWEVLNDAVKAANANEEFTGDNTEVRFMIATSRGLRFGSIGGAEFGLAGVFRLLAKDDLYRSVDLAKSFKNGAPKSVAILAIAKEVLKK
jgi:hypothetical protein